MIKELTLKSRIKVNVGLKIGNKRKDGLHNIHTLFQELDIYDTIYLKKIDTGCHFTSNVDWLKNNADNLCVKSWLTMSSLFEMKGISIHLEKKIPSGSGLGGGSSNAATILKGLNTLYRLNLSSKRLELIGSSIGADVPFFIKGGTQLGDGIGADLTRIDKSVNGSYLLVIPSFQISTAWAYKESKLLLQGFTKNVNFKRLIERDNISFNLFKNDFESVIVPSYPEIGSIKEDLRASGARYASLSGSGSTVYAIFDDEVDAKSAESQFNKSHITFITKPYPNG